MDSPLYPFKKANGSWYSSNDVTDISNQLGYEYGPGSLDPVIAPHAPLTGPREQLHAVKRVSGINRLDHKGSFVIRTQAKTKDGKLYDIGREAILSRWNVNGCRNCQTHLHAKSFVPITKALADQLGDNVQYVVKVQTHRGEVEVENPRIDNL